MVAPCAGSTVSAITLPLRAAFHLGPFTETFQTEKGRDGKRVDQGREKVQRKGEVLLQPRALVSDPDCE